MSRTDWELKKKSKNFYVNTYRKASFALAVSSILNIIFGLGIYYAYFNQPEPDFYATSGIIAPVQLTYMNSPNQTSKPLLEPDPVIKSEQKPIPN